MPLIIDGGTANQEPVKVTKVNYAVNPPTFTANFTKKHAAGAAISAGYPGFPTYVGWGNASAAELTNNPLAFNLYLPNAPSLAPLQMSHQEALLRWSGTNGPALTSSPFRLMPTTFNNTRARNMVTLANWHLDRVTSAPYLSFDRNSPKSQYYSYISGMSYPVVGVNEIQTVVVKGLINGTFALQLPGQTQTMPIALGPNLKNTTVQNAFRRTKGALPPGGTVTVGTITVNNKISPPTYTFTVSFGGTLSNLDVPQLTGKGLTGVPLPTVTVTTQQNGQIANIWSKPPNFAASPVQVPTHNSDYTADWRSTVSQVLRVDLTRPLRDYPAPAASGLITNTSTGSPFDLAQKDRQQFALDIYNALVRVTGARDPNLPVNKGMQPTAPDYQAARWLAQLAVNIVDYIDNDDYMTPFNWNGAEILFGTELPRLVLNEAYVQQETISGQVNVWAELFNSFKTTPAGSTYPLDGGTARLQLMNIPSAKPPYIIEIHESRSPLTSALGSPFNPTGAAPTPPLSIQNNWGTIPTTMQVLPANGVTSGGKIVTVQIDPAPDIKYKGPLGATESKNIVTIHTATPHGLKPADTGKAITVSGVQAPGYDGTFVIASIPSKTTFTYVSQNSGMPPSGVGTATYVQTDTPTGNHGFYVIGPANANYAKLKRAPNLPATYVSPGMSFSTPTANIAGQANKGASHVGTTVTITTTGLPAAFAVGESVVVDQVKTTVGMNPNVDTYYNNSKAGIPFWTIDSINGNSFTFTVPPAVAKNLPTTNSGGGTVTLAYPSGVTLLLRRLANPHLPFNVTTNPYITVDYVDGVPVNTQQPSNNHTVGRNQPYAAATALTQQQQVGNTTQFVTPAQLPSQYAPANTFFSQNSNAIPFDWLVHLDRPPVNPIELLHVSGFRPHELTQRFFTASGKFQHYAPWNPFALSSTSPTGTIADPNSLIYRALDQMSTRYMAGLYTGGRFPGNVNLNTITELEVFQALCDAHDATAQYPNAWFTQGDVQAVFQKLIAARNAGNASLLPTSEGAPFKSFSAASTVKLPVGNSVVSLNDTWFRPDPATGRSLFIPPSAAINANAHPSLQSSILQKIYNNITTTSNVFAVWWTVGFFEVTDESVRPARLGQEIGRSQNRHIRHRFFAIVDRTGMHLFDGTTAGPINLGAGKAVPQTITASLSPSGLSSMGVSAAAWSATQNYLPGNIVTSGGSAYFCTQTPPVGTATTNTAYWQPLLQPGMLLNIDSGNASAEVVTVQSVTGMSFTANFANNHAAGASVFLRGNPGPRSTYNPHDDRGVVLHMSVIK
jgi:hypothetical protein